MHGGVSYAPYAARMRQLIGAPIRTTDTYSASEGGMLAVQDRIDDPGMLPLLDRSTFFEFVPACELDKSEPTRLPIDRVEPGADYAVALTTDSGIVSYLVGDLVRFTSVDPLRLVFAGRTAHTLNAFGEHISGGELDRAIADAATATGAVVREFAVGIDFPNEDEQQGRHVYLVEFHRTPENIEAFSRAVDDTIRRGNEDYATHRTFGLLPPSVVAVAEGTFLEFMRRRGKIGGQHKVPRVVGEADKHELAGHAMQAR